MFIIVIVCILFPYTFAPFVVEPPSPNVLKTCTGWILHHGFEYDPISNKQWSLLQDIQTYRFVSVWAAGYAYALNRNEYYFELSDYTPQAFCKRHVPEIALFTYISLTDAKFTCEGWINFFGHEHRNDFSLNLYWAEFRNKLLDPYISIWAIDYFRYITSDPSRNNITSATFCSGINQDVVELPSEYPFMSLDGSTMSCQEPDNFPELQNLGRQIENDLTKLPFMTRNDTSLTCSEWIALYGYNKQIVQNTNKIWQQKDEFDDFLAICARSYVDYLRNAVIVAYKGVPMTPEKFCERQQMCTIEKLNYDCLIEYL